MTENALRQQAFDAFHAVFGNNAGIARATAAYDYSAAFLRIDSTAGFSPARVKTI